MERNADDMFGATGSQSSTAGATSGASTGGMSNADTDSTTQSTVDQAKATAQTKYAQVKDKARELQSNLADRLDAGAEKLRHRGQTQTLATATEGSSVAARADDRMTKMQDSVAHGMEKSADWLRNGDLKADIERQVRENPGRTLLIALGLGYILGKAFRNNNR